MQRQSLRSVLKGPWPRSTVYDILTRLSTGGLLACPSVPSATIAGAHRTCADSFTLYPSRWASVEVNGPHQRGRRNQTAEPPLWEDVIKFIK